MTKHCINHARVTYDCCRSCNGKDMKCPEYLENKVEVNHSLPTKPKGNLSYRRDNVPYGNNSSSIPDRDKKADTYNPTRQIKPYIDNARVIDVNEERRTKPAEKYTLPIKESFITNHKISFLHKWAEIYDNRFYRKKLIQRRENE
jgi:hypothetical protein